MKMEAEPASETKCFSVLYTCYMTEKVQKKKTVSVCYKQSSKPNSVEV